MKRLLAAISLCTFTAVSTALPASAELFVFPKNGQTKEQQEQDEFSCYKWAKDQTGFDPNKAVEHAAAPAPQVALQKALPRAQPSARLAGRSAEMPARARRSVPESVRQPAHTRNVKGRSSSRQLNSKLRNSTQRTSKATNARLEPAWMEKGTQ
jgi:hypothetical protein